MRPDREELIERLLAGELELYDEELVEAQRDPEFAARVDEVLETLASLDEPSVLEEARLAPPAPVEDELVALVQRELGRKRRPARSRVAGALVVLAAASILAVVLLDPWRGAAEPEERGPAPISLGVEELECLTPRGDGADFAVFRWRAAAPGGTYRVEVFGTDGQAVEGGSSGPLGDVREWRPDEAITRAWPDRIEWELRWAPPGGGSARTAFAEAAR